MNWEKCIKNTCIAGLVISNIWFADYALNPKTQLKHRYKQEGIFKNAKELQESFSELNALEEYLENPSLDQIDYKSSNYGGKPLTEHEKQRIQSKYLRMVNVIAKEYAYNLDDALNHIKSENDSLRISLDAKIKNVWCDLSMRQLFYHDDVMEPYALVSYH